jgi:TonB family protein
MVRRLVLFRPALLATLALTFAVGGGCASDEAARSAAARAVARENHYSPVQQASYSDESSPEMTVQGEEGTLNSQDVEAALHEHFGEIKDCYRLGRRTAPHAGGRVLLRLFVDAKGEVDDVAIVESSIGNHFIERCIADIALGVVFERPAGNKPTTFDYPIEFRPGRPLTADRRMK